MDDILVAINHVSMKFGAHLALQDVSLTVQRNKIVTLIGPNGAGKTTLVKVVLGLITPEQGQITRFAGLRVGYTPQRLNIDSILPLTVQRFLLLSGVKNQSVIQRTLEELEITQFLKRPLQNLSGGEMQRALLARALMREPDLLVLDEPMQGVDVSGQHELYELIDKIRSQRGCGILMVSHDLHLVMAATDNVICLNKQICCSGHPKVVRQHPAYLKLFGANLAIYTHHHDHSTT